MNGAEEVFQDTFETVYFLGNRVNDDTLKYIAIGVGVFLLFLLFSKIFTKYVLGLLIKLFKSSQGKVGRKIIEAFRDPIRDFFIVFGTYLAVLFSGKAFLINLTREPILTHIFKSALIILVSRGCYNLTLEGSVLYEELSEKFNFKLDKIIFPFLSRIMRVIIIGLAVCVILDEWGYNVNGFIAGLGIGGLAFALAAQETIANVFGGLVIILDKPFTIGDYIKTPNVEGTVEDINFRSTKIRALDKGLVTEPNATIAKSTIINWTKRDVRRLSFSIGVTYSTSKDQLQNCIIKIRNMLLEDENVLNEGILVNFDKFGSSSLDILIDCYTNTAQWNKYLQIKEEVNFKVMDILEKEGVSMAFPSSSLYFENPLPKND